MKNEMRLIDANALCDAMRDEEWQSWHPLDEIDSVIDKAPTIDAVPVVHGRWEVVQVWKDNPQTTLKCSACKVNQPIYEHDEWLYCPFCGAKMDGGAEDGNR